MPITLEQYSALPFYEFRDVTQSGQQVRGDAFEFWFRPLLSGQTAPPVVTITTEALANADAESLSVTASASTTLYRGDVLSFGANNAKLAVVAATTTIGATATPLPVLPLIESLASGDTARTYALINVASATDGGIPNITGTMANGRTREGSLFDLKEVVGRSYTISLSGIVLRNEPFIGIMYDLSIGQRSVFWQSRMKPYERMVNSAGATVTNGMGPASRQGIAFVQSFDTPAPSGDMLKYTATLEGNGAPVPYILLTDAV